MYIDSHAHLEMDAFDADRDAVVQRARDAGVTTMVAIGSGSGPGTLDCGIRLAERYAGVYATVGIHPHEARLAREEDFAELEWLARHEKVIAWGEVGLDFFYDHSPREIQREVFVRQMGLAAAAGLPLVIHCRPSLNSEDAWDECLALLREHWRAGGRRGILHCFTGSVPHAQAAREMGFLLSFAGNITFPKAQNIRDAAASLPLDAVLIETDSPFLAPVPFRGKRNEPAFVVEVARQMAALRGTTPESIGRVTSENFQRLFGARAAPRKAGKP